MNGTESEKEPLRAILVIGSAASPPHAGHVHALKEARDMLRPTHPKLDVVAAYIAVAHDGYCRKKYGTKRALSVRHRLALVQLLSTDPLINDTGLLQPTFRPYGSAQECASRLLRDGIHEPGTQVFIVKGEDRNRKGKGRSNHVRIARPPSAVSATAIRRSVNESGGLKEALSFGWVPQSYEEYFDRYPEALVDVATY